MFSAGVCATGTVASSVSGPVWSLSAVAMLTRPSPPPFDLGLRHRVRRRVGPGLADLQHTVAVGVAAAQRRHDRAGIRIGSVTTTPVSVVLPVLVTVIV